MIAQAMMQVGPEFLTVSIPLFMMIFGIAYIGLGFILKPLASLGGGIPIGALVITLALAMMVAFNDTMPIEGMQLLGVGMIVVLVSRMFGGA